MKSRFVLLVLATMISAEGCGTLRNHVALGGDGGEARPYGGVRWDVEQAPLIGRDTEDLFLLEASLSLVGDTLLLPYDVCSH